MHGLEHVRGVLGVTHELRDNADKVLLREAMLEPRVHPVLPHRLHLGVGRTNMRARARKWHMGRTNMKAKT